MGKCKKRFKSVLKYPFVVFSTAFVLLLDETII